MELLKDQCRAHEDYPKQLDPDSKSLDDYFERLRDRRTRLFCQPKDALLEVLDLKVGEQGPWHSVSNHRR